MYTRPENKTEIKTKTKETAVIENHVSKLDANYANIHRATKATPKFLLNVFMVKIDSV